MLSAGGSRREREQLSAQSAPLACAGWELVAKNAWADLIKEILDPLYGISPIFGPLQTAF